MGHRLYHFWHRTRRHITVARSIIGRRRARVLYIYLMPPTTKPCPSGGHPRSAFITSTPPIGSSASAIVPSAPATSDAPMPPTAYNSRREVERLNAIGCRRITFSATAPSAEPTGAVPTPICARHPRPRRCSSCRRPVCGSRSFPIRP